MLGIFQTLFHFDFGKNVYVDLTDKKHYNSLTRLSSNNVNNAINSNNNEKVLRIFQITDTHIGIFKSVESLRKLCEKVVKLNPDLVFLTGDFYSLETRNDNGALSIALSPLSKLKGKCYACLGNHEYEDGQYYDIIKGLKDNSITLLEDEETYIDSKFGKIQLLGARFYFSRTKDKSENLFLKFKRNPEVKYHFTLLHNPNHFKYINNGLTDLVFSGHFHG